MNWRSALCKLVSKMDTWTVLWPLAAVLFILLLLFAIEYLTRTRPLHMVMR